MLAIGAIGWRLSRHKAPNAGPFLVVGTLQTRDTASLGPILRDMLATNLARISGIRVLANSRLLELVPRGADSLWTAVTNAARRAVDVSSTIAASRDVRSAELPATPVAGAADSCTAAASVIPSAVLANH